MRANLNQIERIDLYLKGELSATDYAIFEQELLHNPDLQKNLENQKLIQQAAQRLSIKSICENVAIENAYMTKKSILPKNWGWYFSILCTLGIFVYGSTNSSSNLFVQEELNPLIDSIYASSGNSNYWIDTTSISEEQLKDTPCEFSSIFLLKEEKNKIDNSKNNVLQGMEGTIVFVPKNAFVSKEGKELDDSEITIGIVEALDPLTMMKYGLTTMSGKDVLQSAGMVRIMAYQKDEEVQLKPGKAFEIQIPTDEVNPDMMAWKGVPQPNGSINWEQPKKLENFLNKVPLDQLDFLPTGFAEVVRKGLPYRDYKDASKKNVEEIYFQLKGKTMEGTPTIQNMTFDQPNVRNTKNVVTGSTSYTGQLNFSESVDLKTVLVTITSNERGFKYSSTVNPNSSGSFVFFTPFEISNFSLDISTNCEVISLSKVQMTPRKSTTVNVKNVPCGAKNKKSSPTKGSNIQGDSLDVKTACYIDPLRVKTLLSTNFANTFIATKEFEERLRFMHEQSNGKELLNVYLKNLNKKLWECDSLASRIADGEAKKQFVLWAAMKATNVKNANTNQAELESYLNEQRALFLKERDDLLRQLRKQDYHKLELIEQEIAVIKKERANQIIRENVAYEKKMIDRKRKSDLGSRDLYNMPPRRTVAASPSYKTSWFSTGWINIDAYLKDLSSQGEKRVQINLKGKNVVARVFQSIPVMNVLIPLNRLKNYFEARFPKNLKGKERETFTFALAEEGDKKYFGIIKYDALNSEEVDLVLEEKSLDEIESILKRMVTNPQMNGYVATILGPEIKAIQKANDFLPLKRMKPLVPSEYSEQVKEMTKSIEAKKKQLEDEKQRQMNETIVINGLINFIDPCAGEFPEIERKTQEIKPGMTEFPEKSRATVKTETNEPFFK